jgi:hypothetical protein
MRNDPLIRALEVCIHLMQSGASLEEALGHYPQLKDELRPLLKAAQKAREVATDIQVPKSAQAHSRTVFLQEAQHLSQTRQGFFWGLFSSKFALASLVLLLVLVLGSVTTVAVSAEALPGDPLYGIKLATERTRLLLTENQSQKLKLEQTFDQERVQEVEALIQQARRQEVNFSGGLSQMQGDTWTVGGITVTLTSQTELVGEIKLDYYVHVQGILQPDGTVIASQVQAQTFDISGVIEAMSTDQWTVNALTVLVTPQTIIEGTPAVGSQVHVSAILLSEGRMQANSIEIIGSTTNLPVSSPPESPNATIKPLTTPVPALVNSPTPKHTETSEPEESLEPKETEYEEATKTPEATRTKEAEDTAEPTEAETEERTPEPTESEHEYSSPTPTQVMEATRTPKPTETDDEEKQPATLTPTPTKKATQTAVTPPTPTQTLEPTDVPEITITPDPTELPDSTPTPTPVEEDD